MLLPDFPISSNGNSILPFGIIPDSSLCFILYHPTHQQKYFWTCLNFQNISSLDNLSPLPPSPFTWITQNPLNFILLPSLLRWSQKAPCFFPHLSRQLPFKNVNQCHSLSKKPPGTFHLIHNKSQKKSKKKSKFA